MTWERFILNNALKAKSILDMVAWFTPLMSIVENKVRGDVNIYGPS